MLTVLCWRWGRKYSLSYVEKLRASVARHLSAEHRFAVVTDQPSPGFETIPIARPDLLEVGDGCYARLVMFSPEWRAAHGIGSLICLDLDLIVTGPLAPLFDRPEAFVILHGGHFNPCPYNGSVMLIRPGAPHQVWGDFKPEEAERVARADGTHRGTDQTWIAHKAPGAAGWTHRDGVYAYAKPGWPKGDALPADARLVAFPGAKDPMHLRHVDWVREHWRT